MKNIKTNFKVFIMMILLLSTTGCNNSNKKGDLEDGVITTMRFSVNYENKNDAVADSDYVFVGCVNKVISTEYKDSITILTPNDAKTVANPYTKYSVNNIQNIKGNIKTNEPIEVVKNGGTSKDGKYKVFIEGDILPEKDKCYIMLSYGQPDGSLLMAGPNTNILLESNDLETILKSNIYNEYVKAFEEGSTSVMKRERSKSIYEE